MTGVQTCALPIYLIPDESIVTGNLDLLSMRTTHFEFPFLEYRPVRTFSRRQSMSLVFQLNAGLDIPGKVKMLEPAYAPPLKLKPIWSVGIRLSFDWRFYYAKKRSK